MKDENKIKNSETLFLYDAKMCNPNGDPDEENKPRMDYETERNLVSDVRLKRYIRDYLLSLNKEEEGLGIWVTKVGDKTVSAKKRYAGLVEKFNATKPEKEKIKPKEPTAEFKKWLLNQLVDIRLFGATIPIGEGEGERGGGSQTYTGPVQFSWGYSLHPVEIVPSSTISSTFAGRERTKEGQEEQQEYGTFAKDWRVYYSLLAFYGIISSHRAEKTLLKQEDITLLDNVLLKAIPSEATTRSKLGQTPRLLLRVEYNAEIFLGDLRGCLEGSIKPVEEKRLDTMRDISDYKLDISKLGEILKTNKAKIERIYLWQHPELKSVVKNKDKEEEKQLKALLEEETEFKQKILDLPHSKEEKK